MKRRKGNATAAYLNPNISISQTEKTLGEISSIETRMANNKRHVSASVEEILRACAREKYSRFGYAIWHNVFRPGTNILVGEKSVAFEKERSSVSRCSIRESIDSSISYCTCRFFKTLKNLSQVNYGRIIFANYRCEKRFANCRHLNIESLKRLCANPSRIAIVMS